MGKVQELRPALFNAGEVTITIEAFDRLKQAGVNPRQLVDRHTRGDWSGAPVKWIEKNHQRLHGGSDCPVMSVYQLHPSEKRVCVATAPDLLKTSITNWPDGDQKAQQLNLDAYSRVEKLLSPATTLEAKKPARKPERCIER